MREKTRVAGVLAAAVVGALLATAPPASATTATTTTLVSSVNPSTAGQAITFTAAVGGDSPTGQVVFGESGVILGQVELTNGLASLVVSTLAVGDHAVTAFYGGDTLNDPSSATVTQTVVAPPVTVKPPKVKLKISTAKTSVGDKVRLKWRTKRADSVTASGAWHGSMKAKGSKWLRINQRGKYTFKLTARNAAGAKTAKAKVVATRKAKEFEIVVTDELTMVGKRVDVSADGLAKREVYTVRLNGKILLTGKANKKGDVARNFVLPKTTPEGALPLTITGSNPTRVGTAVLNVIRPKKLDVEVAVPKINKKEEQTVTVTGLAPEEPVTVMYAGEKLTEGKADKSGLFTYDFPVGKESGEKTVRVIGIDPSRNGEVTFTIIADDHSGPGTDL
jgi:hypothetical protein